MEKTKIQGISAVVLLVVGVGIWIYAFGARSGRGTETQIKKNNASSIEQEELTSNFFNEQKQLEQKRPKISWSRNPFHPPLKKMENVDLGIGSLVLSGIAVDEKGKLAMINDEIVREGDYIFGVKIIEITKDSVVIEKDGETHNIKVFKE